MRHPHVLLVSVVLLAAATTIGCTKKAQQSTAETTSDSLVATNPTERASGDITPQKSYEPPPPAPAEQPKASTARPRTPKPAPAPEPKRGTASMPAEDPGVMLAAGTPVKVTVTSDITSETAQPGDTWAGTVKENVIVGDRVVIPAGSTVTGTVRSAKPAVKGDRAMLGLGISTVSVNGKDVAVNGTTEDIIAGSPRARNLGAVAGGAAAGAVVGHAVGGSKGSLIGGLIGGAVSGMAVSSTKGYQVTLKSGTELTFTTDQGVAFKR